MIDRDTVWEILVPIIEKVLRFFTKTVDYTQIMEESYLLAGSYIGGVAEIAKALIPVAITLLSIRWAISLMQDILATEIDLETIMRSLIRLVIAAIIVTNSVELAEGIINFGDNLTKEIGLSGMTVESSIFQNLIDAVEKLNKDPSTTGLIGVIISLIASYFEPLVALVVGFILYVHGWSRSIAITQMFIYAPIGFSDCFRGGMQSGAVRYARKLFALVMEPLIVYMALNAYSYFIQNLGSLSSASVFILPWMQFILLLAMIAFVRGARKLSEDIFAN